MVARVVVVIERSGSALVVVVLVKHVYGAVAGVVVAVDRRQSNGLDDTGHTRVWW